MSLTESGYRVETGAATLSTDAVVLASPAYATARIVRSFNPVLADLCDQVPYASTATVALAFARSAITNPLHGSGFVVPRVERTGIVVVRAPDCILFVPQPRDQELPMMPMAPACSSI